MLWHFPPVCLNPIGMLIMSAPNAERSLPPGDRNDAPDLPLREVARPDPMIGSAIEAAQIGRALVDACIAFADFKLARKRRDPERCEAAALRLKSILNVTDLAALSRRLAKAVGAAQPRPSGGH